jgi:hypothetical protein
MSKLYAALAAIALVFVFAGPGPAGATEQRPDGARNLDQHEFSSHRRRYRYVRRYYGPRYYGPRYRYGHYGPRYRYGYYGPRYRYAYRPYYRRPYWGPGFYAGPSISFGFGFGPRFWW